MDHHEKVFYIHLDTNTGGELVPLLGAGVKLTEPELDLVKVIQLGAHPDVAVARDVCRLLRSQHELELGLLEPGASCNDGGTELFVVRKSFYNTNSFLSLKISIKIV